MSKPSEHIMQTVLRNLCTMTQRAAGPAVVYADKELEEWGDYYVHNHLYERGVLFETFMRDPVAISEAIDRAAQLTHLYQPLLPKQREVADRLAGARHVRAVTIQPRRRTVSITIEDMPGHLADEAVRDTFMLELRNAIVKGTIL